MLFLTDGYSSVGANKVAVGLRDSSHTDLIECTSEEACEGAAEDNVAITASHSHAHADKILLSDEALHIAIGECILVGQREGGVLGVTIHGDDTLTRFTQLDKGISIYLTSCNLDRGQEHNINTIKN